MSDINVRDEEHEACMAVRSSVTESWPCPAPAAHRFIVGQHAYPSPLGYHGFPKSVCTSVNEVAVHGIPDSRPLEDGDIVNVVRDE